MAERDEQNELKCRGCGEVIKPGEGRYMFEGYDKGPFCYKCRDERKRKRGEIGPGPITK